jgi:hypothetical protein
MNIFSVRKYAALLLVALVPMLVFQIGLLLLPYLVTVLFTLAVTLLLLPFAILLINNPFTKMLEGGGLITLNIDSSGVGRPFIIRMKGGNWISAKIGREYVEDVFNRDTVMQLKDPIVAHASAKEVLIDGKKYFLYALTEDEYNGARHSLTSKPFLIWNNQTKCFITKDWWGTQEKDLFAEHVSLRIDRRISDIGASIKNFARAVVDIALKPQVPFYQQWWFWLIILGILGLLAIMFGPKILSFVKGATGGVGQTVQNVVTPK